MYLKRKRELYYDQIGHLKYSLSLEVVEDSGKSVF